MRTIELCLSRGEIAPCRYRPILDLARSKNICGKRQTQPQLCHPATPPYGVDFIMGQEESQAAYFPVPMDSRDIYRLRRSLLGKVRFPFPASGKLNPTPLFSRQSSAFCTWKQTADAASFVIPPNFQNLAKKPKKSPPWGDFTLAFLARFCYDNGNVL